MSVICVIWYKIFTVFQNCWGGGLAPPALALPLVSAAAQTSTRKVSSKYEPKVIVFCES